MLEIKKEQYFYLQVTSIYIYKIMNNAHKNIRTSNFSYIAGHEVIQNSIVFLHRSNEKSEKEIKKVLPL